VEVRDTVILTGHSPSLLAHAENVGIDTRLNGPVVVKKRDELLLRRRSPRHVGESSVVAALNHLGPVVAALEDGRRGAPVFVERRRLNEREWLNRERTLIKQSYSLRELRVFA
jgi:hypothetical protein